MVYSASMAVQDLVRNNIWLAGDTMFTYRDGWLGRMKYRMLAPNIDELRAGSLNTEKLFDPAVLTRGTKAAKSKKTSKVQDELINKVSGKQTFGKQSSSRD